MCSLTEDLQSTLSGRSAPQRLSRNIQGIYNIIMMCFKALHVCAFHMKVRKQEREQGWKYTLEHAQIKSLQ